MVKICVTIFRPFRFFRCLWNLEFVLFVKFVFLLPESKNLRHQLHLRYLR